MKKRSFVAILVATFALFVSSAFISSAASDTNNEPTMEVKGGGGGIGGNMSGDVTGTYIPD